MKTVLECKKAIFKEIALLENEADFTGNLFPPEKLAKFLLLLQKVKHRPELDIFLLFNIPKESTALKTVNFWKEKVQDQAAGVDIKEAFTVIKEALIVENDPNIEM